MYVATFHDAYAMRTAKHVKVTWTDDEQMVDEMCRTFYLRARNNNFDKGESLKDVDDYIHMVKDRIDDLTYEHPSLNDEMKRREFKSWLYLLNSLLTTKKPRTSIL